MPLIWKLILIIWDLFDSSSLRSGKVQSFIGTNMQKPLYDLSILKVMTVCISTFACISDFSAIAKSTLIDQILSLIQLTCFAARALISNFSHFSVPEMTQFNNRSTK